MKKVVKIKESKILNIIDRIVSEQTGSAQTITVSATNSLGTAPNFDGLFTLIRTLKANVEKALRGSTPYRIKSDNPDGVAIAKKQGGALKLEVTLVQSKPEDRDWYFDAALSIYSAINTDSVDIMKSRVMSKASAKGQAFSGSEKKVGVLGKNTLVLSAFKNLDPNDPEKVFKIYIMYIAAGKPEGYQEVGDEEGVETSSEQPASQQPDKQQTQPGNVNVVAKPVGELNEIVSSGYTASNCDELHAFQSTGGKVIGNMNDIVGKKLRELYNKGYNPMVTDVEVTVNGMSVNWSCTIKNSPDGKAWVGFTSRGAGCNNNIAYRSEKAKGNDPQSVIDNIKQVYGESSIDFQKISEANYTVKEGTEEEKKNSFRQIFYIYTKPKSFPPHK